MHVPKSVGHDTIALREQEEGRTDSIVGVNWQFTTDDARIKLRRLYPRIERDGTLQPPRTQGAFCARLN